MSQQAKNNESGLWAFLKTKLGKRLIKALGVTLLALVVYGIFEFLPFVLPFISSNKATDRLQIEKVQAHDNYLEISLARITSNGEKEFIDPQEVDRHIRGIVNQSNDRFIKIHNNRVYLCAQDEGSTTFQITGTQDDAMSIDTFINLYEPFILTAKADSKSDCIGENIKCPNAADIQVALLDDCKFEVIVQNYDGEYEVLLDNEKKSGSIFNLKDVGDAWRLKVRLNEARCGQRILEYPGFYDSPDRSKCKSSDCPESLREVLTNSINGYLRDLSNEDAESICRQYILKYNGLSSFDISIDGQKFNTWADLETYLLVKAVEKTTKYRVDHLEAPDCRITSLKIERI